MSKDEIRQYIGDIIYCSALSHVAMKPEFDKELENNICEAIDYIFKNSPKGIV